jgi:antibiotic biosynthesis monooxygenase (ABM) superfamily enzyme
MVVTVFRSRLQPKHTAEYYEVATQMCALAEGMPGFVS